MFGGGGELGRGKTVIFRCWLADRVTTRGTLGHCCPPRWVLEAAMRVKSDERGPHSAVVRTRDGCCMFLQPLIVCWERRGRCAAHSHPHPFRISVHF